MSNPVQDRALLPNGPIIQLGTFEDILSEFSDSRTMTIEFELTCEREDTKLEGPDFYNLSNHKIVATFGKANAGTSFSAIEASKVLVECIRLQSNFEFNMSVDGEDVEHQTISKQDLVIKNISEDDLKHFLENSATEYSGSIYMSEKPLFLGELKSNNGVTGKDTSEQFLLGLSHFLPTIVVHKAKKGTKIVRESSSTLHLNEMFKSKPIIEAMDSFFETDQITRASQQITRFFTSKIRYLGSLRTDPDTTHRTFAPTSELDDVGPKGEYSAVVYHFNQNASIQWYNPQIRQVEQGTLQEAVDTWAQYLGIANQIRTEMAGAIGAAWKITIKEGQKARSLPEVGVGVNQVLPILVMGLLSPKNALLILEQPELHLHATVQARLGDFFVGLSKCKKQCLIETHSENLVSQLRYHIVQSGGQEESGCMIYFVDQDEKGVAKFEPIEISPQGNILNWPDGFFDETMLQEDRITAASIKKRASNR